MATKVHLRGFESVRIKGKVRSQCCILLKWKKVLGCETEAVVHTRMNAVYGAIIRAACL